MFLLITFLKQLSQPGNSSQLQPCCLLLQNPCTFICRDWNGFWISTWDAKIWHVITCEHQNKCKKVTFYWHFWICSSWKKEVAKNLLLESLCSLILWALEEIRNLQTFTKIFLAYFTYNFPILICLKSIQRLDSSCLPHIVLLLLMQHPCASEYLPPWCHALR